VHSAAARRAGSRRWPLSHAGSGPADQLAPLLWVRRLGPAHGRHSETTLLRPGAPTAGRIDSTWHVQENVDLEQLIDKAEPPMTKAGPGDAATFAARSASALGAGRKRR
jgi:hypothetical protein